jgi:chemotaxis signal transduction protein
MTFNNDIYGFLVDQIEGSYSYDHSLLEPSLSTSEDQTNYFLGLYQSNTVIINVDAILNDLKLKLS